VGDGDFVLVVPSQASAEQGMNTNLVQIRELPPRAAIRIKTLAEWLEVGDRTALSLIKDKHDPIPAIRIGSEIRVRIDDLREWLARRPIVGEQ
jgi:excisionase family DNA binding protein